MALMQYLESKAKTDYVRKGEMREDRTPARTLEPLVALLSN